MADIIR